MYNIINAAKLGSCTSVGQFKVCISLDRGSGVLLEGERFCSVTLPLMRLH